MSKLSDKWMGGDEDDYSFDKFDDYDKLAFREVNPIDESFISIAETVFLEAYRLMEGIKDAWL